MNTAWPNFGLRHSCRSKKEPEGWNVRWGGRLWIRHEIEHIVRRCGHRSGVDAVIELGQPNTAESFRRGVQVSEYTDKRLSETKRHPHQSHPSSQLCLTKTQRNVPLNRLSLSSSLVIHNVILILRHSAPEVTAALSHSNFWPI